MVPQEDNITQLVVQFSDSEFYIPLVKQVKKDFELSGHSIAIDEFMAPGDLIKEVHRQIHHLLQYNFDAYLQLLYRVDIPETLMSFTTENSDAIAQKATFYILQREWKKVKLRAKFK